MHISTSEKLFQENGYSVTEPFSFPFFSQILGSQAR